MAAAAPMASRLARLAGRNGHNRGTSISIPLTPSAAINTSWLGPVPIHGIRIMLAIGAAAAIALLLAGTVSPVPGNLIAYGRRMMTSMGRSEVLFTGEGINSSIAITRWDDGAIQFHVSGKVEASTESYD